MALKAELAPKTEAPKTVSAAAKEAVVGLELAFYTNYNLAGVEYTKGQVYQFSRKTAMELLTEMDHKRPVWRIYQPSKTAAAPSNIVDRTQITLKPAGEPIHGIETGQPTSINVGTDDEIRDVLDAVANDGGNVTL